MMALSNIFNEPRREITETVVGVAVVAGPLVLFVILDYMGALVLMGNCPYEMSFPVALLLAGVMLIELAVLGILAAIGIHKVGELACDALEEGGPQLRPIDRRRRW